MSDASRCMTFSFLHHTSVRFRLNHNKLPKSCSRAVNRDKCSPCNAWMWNHLLSILCTLWLCTVKVKHSGQVKVNQTHSWLKGSLYLSLQEINRADPSPPSAGTCLCCITKTSSIVSFTFSSSLLFFLLSQIIFFYYFYFICSLLQLPLFISSHQPTLFHFHFLQFHLKIYPNVLCFPFFLFTSTFYFNLKLYSLFSVLLLFCFSFYFTLSFSFHSLTPVLSVVFTLLLFFSLNHSFVLLLSSPSHFLTLTINYSVSALTVQLNCMIYHANCFILVLYKQKMYQYVIIRVCTWGHSYHDEEALKDEGEKNKPRKLKITK